MFKLGEVDLILGVSWLASLREVKINWRNLTMSFGLGEKETRIKGDPTLTKRVITFEARLKETEIEGLSLV